MDESGQEMTIEAWMDEINRLWSDYVDEDEEKTYAIDFKDWKPYYDDGLTPDQALAEDLSCG